MQCLQKNWGWDQLLLTSAEHTAEQTNHLRERLVCRFRIESRPHVPREGVLRWIQQRVIANAGLSQRLVNSFASRVRHVRILRPEDHQKLSANLFGASQRSSIGILAELAVMDASAVVTHRS